jgi:uncharacterized membrane protein
MNEASRIDALEQRLAAIEKHLGIPTASAAEPPVLPTTVPLPPVAQELAVPSTAAVSPAPPDLPPFSQDPAIPSEPVPTADELIASLNSPSPVSPPPILTEIPFAHLEPAQRASKLEAVARLFGDERAVVRLRFLERVRAFFRKRDKHLREPWPAVQPSRARRASDTLERTIGLKWSGWIGAVVLVIGAAMGVQFAWQNHWFGRLPPAFRLAMIFAVGAALLAAGEWVLRKIHQVPAASLFGAGVAVLFLGSYSGYAYFDLYARSTSLYLMAASTLIGAAVAMRGNLVSIAVLSLIGANLAPVMVGTPDAPVMPFLFYLLMMLVVALTLAAWGRGGKWWILRGLSLCPTVFWMGMILDGPHGKESIVVWFLTLFGVLYHAELILTTTRTAAKSDQRTTGEGLAAVGTTFAICVTTAITFGLLRYFSNSSDTTRAGIALLLSGISAALGFGLPRWHPSLRGLGMSHRAAAAGLLALAVPLYCGGVRLEFGWMVLAVGFACSWHWTRSPVSRAAAPIIWCLGLSKLAMSVVIAVPMAAGSALGATWLTILNTPIGSTTVLAWLFALSGHCIAALIIDERDDSLWTSGAKALSGFCTLTWIGASIFGLPNLGATSAIIAYAWLMFLLAHPLSRLGVSIPAVASLLIASAKWAVIDTLAARLSPEWTTTRPVFNSLTGVGVLAAGSLLGFHRASRGLIWRSSRRREAVDSLSLHPLNLAVTLIAIALLTISLSFEIDRVVQRAMIIGWTDPLPAWQVRQLSFTILWSIALAAAGMVILKPAAPGMAVTSKRLVWFLIALLAGKFIVIDTLMAYTDSLSVTPSFAAHVRPLWNLEVLAGIAIVACIAWTQWIACRAGAALVDNDGWGIGVLVAILIGWIGTLEIDRYVAGLAMQQDPVSITWHLKQLGWTIWWTIVTSLTMLICRRLDKSAKPAALWITLYPLVLGLLVIKYISVDLLFMRMCHSPPEGWMVLINWDCLAAATVGIGAWLPRWVARAPELKSSALSGVFEKLAIFSTVAILLFAGTMEVDRAFMLPSFRESLHDAALAEQVALSIYWSVFAVCTLAAGFWKRSAGLRYIGLALLAMTLVKVTVLDLSHVRYGYRVLSFLGLGAILLITSVMYGKISPLLLQQGHAEANE